MIRDILSIAPWWFWVFLAPELFVMALTAVFWVVMVIVAGVAALIGRPFKTD